MHPYEVATRARQRAERESVRLNYGSLYGVVESLEKHSLVTPAERTRGPAAGADTCTITEAGRIEMTDWLTVPDQGVPAVRGPPLSFMPALPPRTSSPSCARAQALQMDSRTRRRQRELVQKAPAPRCSGSRKSSV